MRPSFTHSFIQHSPEQHLKKQAKKKRKSTSRAIYVQKQQQRRVRRRIKDLPIKPQLCLKKQENGERRRQNKRENLNRRAIKVVSFYHPKHKLFCLLNK